MSTHNRGCFCNGLAESAPPGAELHRQRVRLLAPEFGSTRPQRHPNARNQKGYGAQMEWLRRGLSWLISDPVIL